MAWGRCSEAHHCDADNAPGPLYTGALPKKTDSCTAEIFMNYNPSKHGEKGECTSWEAPSSSGDRAPWRKRPGRVNQIFFSRASKKPHKHSHNLAATQRIFLLPLVDGRFLKKQLAVNQK